MNKNNNNNVVFINSPTLTDQYISPERYLPLGLMSMATVLKNRGVDVEIIDANNVFHETNYNEDLLRKYVVEMIIPAIRDHKPAIIGIGSIFSGSFKSLRIIAQLLKKEFPEIPTAIGGMHATLFAGEIIKKYSYIDYVVMGEGEYTFPELLGCICDDSKSLDSIDGLAYRTESGVQVNPKTRYIDNLDELPFIDFGLVNVKKYRMDTSKWFSPKNLRIEYPLPIISSRSCPERCTFCCNWLIFGDRIRFRSADNVLDEIEYLYYEHGVRAFDFLDDSMAFSKKRTLKICNGIKKRNLNIQFNTPNGLACKRLDKESVDALVEAGLTRVSIAIESGSEYMRNTIMKKGLSTKKVHEVINSCAAHKDLFLQAFFIVGFPKETHETLQDTFDMIRDMPFDKIGVFYATPYPGTKLFNYCRDHKLITADTESMVDIDYLQHISDRPHFKPFNLTIEELMDFQKKCYEFQEEKIKLANVPVNHPIQKESIPEIIDEHSEANEHPV
jgi:radical SAM superfamily enzyme YgiQ (UPF0313 family)